MMAMFMKNISMLGGALLIFKKRTISHAPSFAQYPNRMLNPPATAITPDNGTPREARGTPCDAA
jgi:hypothetical protein